MSIVLDIIILAIILLIVYVKNPNFKNNIKKFISNNTSSKLYADNEKSTDAERFEYSVAKTLSDRSDVYEVYNGLYFCSSDLQIANVEVTRGGIERQGIIAVTKYGIVAVTSVNIGYGRVTICDGDLWAWDDGNGRIETLAGLENPLTDNQRNIDFIKKVESGIDIPIMNAAVFPEGVNLALANSGDMQSVQTLLKKYPYICTLDKVDELMETVAKAGITIGWEDAKKYRKVLKTHMFVDTKIKRAQDLYARKRRNEGK
jgi:hypothetical protein